MLRANDAIIAPADDNAKSVLHTPSIFSTFS
jgi:hypothetical protein